MTQMLKKNANELDHNFRYEISEKVGAKFLRTKINRITITFSVQFENVEIVRQTLSVQI